MVRQKGPIFGLRCILQQFVELLLLSVCVCLLVHCSAKAYQSIIMLRGSQQLHNYWHGKAKVNHLQWTEETASQVLEAWKREFTKV